MTDEQKPLGAGARIVLISLAVAVGVFFLTLIGNPARTAIFAAIGAYAITAAACGCITAFILWVQEDD